MLVLIGIIFFILAGVSFFMETHTRDKFYEIMGIIFLSFGVISIGLLAIIIPFDNEEITIEPISVLQRNNEIIALFESENNDIKVLTDNTARLYNKPSNVVVKAITKINSYKYTLRHNTEYKLILRGE